MFLEQLGVLGDGEPFGGGAIASADAREVCVPLAITNNDDVEERNDVDSGGKFCGTPAGPAEGDDDIGIGNGRGHNAAAREIEPKRRLGLTAKVEEIFLDGIRWRQR